MNRLIPQNLYELATSISDCDLKLEVINHNCRAHKVAVASQTVGSRITERIFLTFVVFLLCCELKGWSH